MADQIVITVPEITGVSLTPNPTTTGAALTALVTVKETSRVLTPLPFACGEICCGEN